ncbi:MAG: histidinol-phosphate transaminase [Calditrichaceae bacterium]|nr:histidinol-phosphate transaminase [Calditrichaceae bacterium]MBN2708871.1 histidinol-phosphate transaminase [Calditrichaceae bacterium]RQV97603.1 MAG: histidinol-phosphate transaminase [Calditrichota bacterium]
MTIEETVKLARPNILTLKPYACARDEFKGQADIFLDANENSMGSVLSEAMNRYPDPLQVKLKEKIAEVKQVNPNQIFLGNGSDEAIDLLYRVFCQPGQDSVIIQPPTYGMYGVSANINDVKILEAPLTPDFQPDVEKVISLTGAYTKMIFFCSPNNPSANIMDVENVKMILTKFPGIVIIDEAYIDFSEKKSWIEELNRYPNLVVMQTFSKAWGMAGLRLGMLFAHPQIISLMNKTKPPYNVNECTQKLAFAALSNKNHKDEMVKMLLSERANLINGLSALKPVKKVYPSDANFLLVKFNDAGKMYKDLMNRSIIVRNRSSMPGCDNCLRITVGKPDENKRLIQTIKELDTK